MHRGERLGLRLRLRHRGVGLGRQARRRLRSVRLGALGGLRGAAGGGGTTALERTVGGRRDLRGGLARRGEIELGGDSGVRRRKHLGRRRRAHGRGAHGRGSAHDRRLLDRVRHLDRREELGVGVPGDVARAELGAGARPLVAVLQHEEVVHPRERAFRARGLHLVAHLAQLVEPELEQVAVEDLVHVLTRVPHEDQRVFEQLAHDVRQSEAPHLVAVELGGSHRRKRG
mmetsp:Transcript_58880/g.140054  ORF Transcript_58880/g.140054 Transcript_58880/m.140054 type:complete len:229 (+) Transcript_58880:1647-2333(+)